MSATTSADLYAASRARLTEVGLGFTPRILAGQVPACPDGTYQLGSGEPAAEVYTEAYELFRAAFGRRSPAQLRAWRWSSSDAAESWSTELAFLPQTQIDLID